MKSDYKTSESSINRNKTEKQTVLFFSKHGNKLLLIGSIIIAILILGFSLHHYIFEKNNQKEFTHIKTEVELRKQLKACEGYIYSNTDSGLALARDGYSSATDIGSIYLKGEFARMSAIFFCQKTEYCSGLYYFLISRDCHNRNKKHDKESYDKEISALNGIGVLYLRIKEYSKAFNYFIEADKFDSTSTIINKTKILVNEGIALEGMGNSKLAYKK